jgi:hypothetical protein
MDCGRDREAEFAGVDGNFSLRTPNINYPEVRSGSVCGGDLPERAVGRSVVNVRAKFPKLGEDPICVTRNGWTSESMVSKRIRRAFAGEKYASVW